MVHLTSALFKVLEVFCKGCSTKLFKYNKGGSGHLIKIRQHKVLKDFTDDSRDNEARLRAVQRELESVERELDELLDRQSQLLQERDQLQEAVARSAAAATASSRDWSQDDFRWSKKLREVRESVFKISSYRPLQLQTMNASLSGQDAVLIMPTGGGKSLCFQLPALVSSGVTLVVSPLVSLMEDQLYALRRLGVQASMLNASTDKAEVNRVHAAMTDSNSPLKLLYVTPEKLAKSKRFMNKLEKMYEAGRFSRLVIDEVHCCSQWGHDFRPDYKFLGIMKTQFATVPIMGLTATATASVITDIQKMLHIQHSLVFRASFNRKNLFYEVRSKPQGLKACMEDTLRLINSRFKHQSGIIYCFSQKDAEEVASELQLRNVPAGCYHAGMAPALRSQVHQRWLSGKVQVVVATIAFGMGIDKPDVRFVLHYSISKSMENYYQESGRAGRDDERAVVVLYWSFTDAFRQSTMVFTEQTGLTKLYAMLAYACDTNRCRRAMIADHFGERWSDADCAGMCDHCSPAHKAREEHDVSQYCHDVVRILRHNGGKKQRVTGLKVLDAWQCKGATLHRAPGLKMAPPLSRPDLERLLVQLLLESYIKEDFHFTAYSTISYLVPGPRSAQLDKPDHKVLFSVTSMLSKSNSKTATKTSSKTKSESSSASSASISKKTPCAVSSNNSAFNSSFPASSLNSSSNLNNLKSSSSLNMASKGAKESARPSKSSSTSNNGSKDKAKKRRKLVVLSDTDSDLDFGGEIVPAKKTVRRNGAPNTSSIGVNGEKTGAAGINGEYIAIVDSDSEFE